MSLHLFVICRHIKTYPQCYRRMVLNEIDQYFFKLIRHIYFCVKTSSNGDIFRVTGPLCGEFTGYRWIPLTKVSNAELLCFLWSAHGQIKWLSKQLRRRWFETPSRSLWHHSYGIIDYIALIYVLEIFRYYCSFKIMNGQKLRIDCMLVHRRFMIQTKTI